LKGRVIWTGGRIPWTYERALIARRRLINSDIQALGRRKAVLEDAGS
jgi:hypothetical protein